jgi:uncharacterized protein (TIGR02246 family)
VTALTDTRAIERLFADYAFHLDMNQPDALAALFTGDCEVSFSPGSDLVGRENLRKRLDGIGTYFAATSHHISNIAIDFAGDDMADVRAVLFACHRYRDSRPDGLLYGQYRSRVVRLDAQWRFHYHRLLTTMSTSFHIEIGHPIGRSD